MRTHAYCARLNTFSKLSSILLSQRQSLISQAALSYHIRYSIHTYIAIPAPIKEPPEKRIELSASTTCIAHVYSTAYFHDIRITTYLLTHKHFPSRSATSSQLPFCATSRLHHGANTYNIRRIPLSLARKTHTIPLPLQTSTNSIKYTRADTNNIWKFEQWATTWNSSGDRVG